MTLYAYEVNSVMVGMLAVLIPVAVAFAWLLQREQRKATHVDWLLAEINAMRAELHRHGIEYVSFHPRDDAPVPSMRPVPDGGEPADNGTLTVAATEEIAVPIGTLVFPRLWVSSDGTVYNGDKPVPVGPPVNAGPSSPEQSLMDYMIERAWVETGQVVGDKPISPGAHVRPEPDGGAVKAEQSLKEYMEPSDREKQAYREWDAWEDELDEKLGKCETEDQINAVWGEMTAKSGVLVRRYRDVPLPVARMWGRKWRDDGK